MGYLGDNLSAPYVSAALNNNDDDTEIHLPNNDTSQYYTITDPSSSSEEPKPAAANGDGKEADNTTAIATATLGKGKEKKPLKQIAIHATTTTIKPSSSSKPNDDTNTNNNDTNSDNNNNDDTNTKLDIFTYHRGRCGQEPRDPSTGELLCDTDPIDTNYKWQPTPFELDRRTRCCLHGGEDVDTPRAAKLIE